MKLTQRLREDSGYAFVLSRLDTASPLGYALSREGVWYGPGQEGELNGELDRVAAAMALEPGAADRLIHCISFFKDIRGSFRRDTGAPMDILELFEVKHFLLSLQRLAEVYAAAPLEGIELACREDLVELMDPEGRRLPAFSIHPAYEPALARIREEKRQVEQRLRDAAEAEKDALHARRRELVRAEDEAELGARKRLTAILLREKDWFLTAMEQVGRLDLTLAKARLAKKLGGVRPVVGGDAVRLTEMFHPQVAHRLEERGIPFTPVTVELIPGSTVITGANMGGKSVALKTVTLNLLLLHTGYFVFARAMTSPLFSSVSLICSDGQSVDQGLSSFGAEVWYLSEVLREEKADFFLALDEFARGTNPREGAALAAALARHLNGLPCTALLTTHYDGVASAARRHYQVAGLAGMEEEGTGERALDDLPRRMDYRLIPAPPDAPCPRDAMKVCRLLGLEKKLMAAFEENA